MTVEFIELLAPYIDLPNSLSANVRFARAFRAANTKPRDEQFTMKLKDLVDKKIDVGYPKLLFCLVDTFPYSMANSRYIVIDVSRCFKKRGKNHSIDFIQKRHFRPLRFGTASTANPKISLIIPAHNESISIKKTILSALENPYQNKEIIIVDDHSTDDTYQQALPFLEGGVIKLLKRSGGKGSRAAAVNYGTLSATGYTLYCIPWLWLW